MVFRLPEPDKLFVLFRVKEPDAAQPPLGEPGPAGERRGATRAGDFGPPAARVKGALRRRPRAKATRIGAR